MNVHLLTDPQIESLKWLAQQKHGRNSRFQIINAISEFSESPVEEFEKLVELDLIELDEDTFYYLSFEGHDCLQKLEVLNEEPYDPMDYPNRRGVAFEIIRERFSSKEYTFISLLIIAVIGTIITLNQQQESDEFNSTYQLLSPNTILIIDQKTNKKSLLNQSASDSATKSVRSPLPD